MSPPIRDGSGSSIGSIRLGDGSEIAEVRTGAGDVVFSAIPDSVVDNFESADTNPVGPYKSGDDISTFYETTTGSFARNSTAPLKDSHSLERTTVSGNFDSDAILSVPGDGLPNYPAEGETLSAIVTDISQRPTLLAAVPDNTPLQLQGYGLHTINGEEMILRRYDGTGNITDLAEGTPLSYSLPIELVLSPPASGENTVEASAFALDGNLERSSLIVNLSATDNTYAGNRGIGIIAADGSTTGGVIADELRIGRSL